MFFQGDTPQYTGSNVSQNYGNNQPYKPPSTSNTQPNYLGPSQNYNQGYGTGNQSYGNNPSYGGNNMTQQPPPPPQQPQYGQGMKNNTTGFGQNQGFQPGQGGQNMGGNFNRGGYGGTGMKNICCLCCLFRNL